MKPKEPAYIRVLDNLANDYEKHPTKWCQDEWGVTSKGKVIRFCLMGGLEYYSRKNGVIFTEAVAYMKKALPVSACNAPLVWNDAPRRTVKQVIAVLRKAAKLARKNFTLSHQTV